MNISECIVNFRDRGWCAEFAIDHYLLNDFFVCPNGGSRGANDSEEPMMMKLPILPCAEKRASFVYRTKNVDNNDKDKTKDQP